jgi:heat shock protein HslJ
MAAAAFRAFALALSCVACTSVSVDGRTLEGTHWRVAAIDGRQTPADGEYRIEFSGGRISGRFGCNRWGGNYALAGETLTSSQVISTKMACQGLAMMFENQGISVLNQPARLAWTSGQKLTLINGAGSIELELQR